MVAWAGLLCQEAATCLPGGSGQRCSPGMDGSGLLPRAFAWEPPAPPTGHSLNSCLSCPSPAFVPSAPAGPDRHPPFPSPREPWALPQPERAPSRTRFLSSMPPDLLLLWEAELTRPAEPGAGGRAERWRGAPRRPGKLLAMAQGTTPPRPPPGRTTEDPRTFQTWGALPFPPWGSHAQSRKLGDICIYLRHRSSRRAPR